MCDRNGCRKDLFKIKINTHDILYLKMKISYIMQFLKNKNK